MAGTGHEHGHDVLFLCTGNSARSILAEALLNHLGGGRFRAQSAGSIPTGRVNPFALKLLAQMNVPASGARSKSWDEFAAPGGIEFEFVITLCDRAAAETCPAWPGQPVAAHWGVPDPVSATGSDATRMHAFGVAFAALERRIRQLVELPLAALDRAGLERALDAIGSQPALPEGEGR